MRSHAATAAVLALAGLSACGGSKPAERPSVAIAITDNAFQRAGHDRPTLHVRTGTAVRWAWRGQESHQLSVRSGPERFGSRTQTRGAFTHTFTRAGTYRLECSLHAPGMRMTVVVG